MNECKTKKHDIALPVSEEVEEIESEQDDLARQLNSLLTPTCSGVVSMQVVSNHEFPGRNKNMQATRKDNKKTALNLPYLCLVFTV